jgi:hypothetical protein
VKRAADGHGSSAATLMWVCVALFAACVIGQVEIMLLAPDWLSPMEAWLPAPLPYHLLLPAQILVLVIMAAMAGNPRLRDGSFAAENPGTARTWRVLALMYFAFMAGRLALNLIDHGEDFWHHGAIPVAIHWVLALFLLVSVREAPPSIQSFWMPTDDGDEYEEADHVTYGDVPAMSEPLQHGPGFREEIRYGYSR